MPDNDKCETCGAQKFLGRCVNFTQHKKPTVKKEKKKQLHVWKPDPHGDKEDTRPIHKRKKPKLSMQWKKLKELLDLD